MKRKTQKYAGFTLTEILVVIIVITLLATLSLAGLSAIRQQSNIEKTQRTVQKIHILLMEKLEEYQTRRIKVNHSDDIPDAVERTSKMYDLIRMEIPDRASDLGILSSSPNCACLNNPPAANNSYSRKYNTGKDTSSLHSDSAELLYMIIMRIPGAAEEFSEFEIGDTDNDGLKEFIDGWGHSIHFIRWPYGYCPGNDNDISPDPNNDIITNLQPYNLKTNPPTMLHDPTAFLPLPANPVDPNGAVGHICGTNSYAIYPLIFSSGPDGKYDISKGRGSNSSNAYAYKLTPITLAPGKVINVLDPFQKDDQGWDIGISINETDYASGQATENHLDNITNHALE